eukprot:1956307-Amphidinium_carterae.1
MMQHPSFWLNPNIKSSPARAASKEPHDTKHQANCGPSLLWSSWRVNSQLSFCPCLLRKLNDVPRRTLVCKHKWSVHDEPSRRER